MAIRAGPRDHSGHSRCYRSVGQIDLKDLRQRFTELLIHPILPPPSCIQHLLELYLQTRLAMRATGIECSRFRFPAREERCSVFNWLVEYHFCLTFEAIRSEMEAGIQFGGLSPSDAPTCWVIVFVFVRKGQKPSTLASGLGWSFGSQDVWLSSW